MNAVASLGDGRQSGLNRCSLALKGVSHHFGSTVALSQTDLFVEAGTLMVLLGPSGCGKSTLLRIIAGLIVPTAGSIHVNDVDVSGVPPEDRRVGIVFQNFALFPHMTVEQNVAYGLEARGHPRSFIAKRVGEILALVRLDGLGKRYPRQLSGGQQQRTALARALAFEPELLLLDEPFGALDKNLRLEMQVEVRRVQQELGITTVLVTHDQEEALSMSDRIAVMRSGAIVQCGTPSEIYDRPADLFVSGFIGNMNILKAELLGINGTGARFRIGANFEFLGPTCDPHRAPGQVFIAVRPEAMLIDQASSQGLSGALKQVARLGPLVHYSVVLDDGASITVSVPRGDDDRSLRVGDRVGVRFKKDIPYSVFAP